jgi:hypothetical protein
LSIGGILPPEQMAKLVRTVAATSQLCYDECDPHSGGDQFSYLLRLAKDYHQATLDRAKLSGLLDDSDKSQIEGEAEMISGSEEHAREVLRLAAQYGVLPAPKDDSDTTLER